MFAIFTRLTRDDGAPRTESLRPRERASWWTWPDRGPSHTLRVVMFIPLALALVALFAFVAITSPATSSCATTRWPHSAVLPARACQPAPGPHGHF